VKGDYLWDGSGEPDPDVQQLERALGEYRHKGRAPRLPVVTPVRRRVHLNWMAIAAALVIMALAGLWVASRRQAGVYEPAPQVASTQQAPAQDPSAEKNQAAPAPAAARAPAPRVKGDRIVVARGERRAARVERPRLDVTPEAGEPRAHGPGEEDAGISEIAALSSIAMTGVDSEVTRHIEQAQLLLRSFRNVQPARRRADVAYERKLSRELLYKNIMLRRDAQAKGEEPVAHLLSDLEPYLIDIANLPGKASREDLASIKQRMQKQEIMATLQVYSLQASNPIY
jgi:hypothetical protein